MLIIIITIIIIIIIIMIVTVVLPERSSLMSFSKFSLKIVSFLQQTKQQQQ